MIIEARQGGGESAWYELYNLLLSFNALRDDHAHGGQVSVWPQPYLYQLLTRAVALAMNKNQGVSFKGVVFSTPIHTRFGRSIS